MNTDEKAIHDVTTSHDDVPQENIAEEVVVQGNADWIGNLRIDVESGRNTVVRTVQTPQQLVAQVSVLLHRVAAKMSEAHRQALRGQAEAGHALKGRKVMVVDDDVRNIFALTSLLEDYGMAVVAHDSITV